MSLRCISRREMTTPPHHHRYMTRSSPDLPTQATPPAEEALFRLRTEILVKDTVCGRDSNAKRLPQHVFEGSSWNAIRDQMFNHCLPQIQFKASHAGEPRVWTDKATPNDFGCFISMKMGRYIFKPSNTTQGNGYLADHQRDTFTI
jgi:hypothetical protein